MVMKQFEMLSQKSIRNMYCLYLYNVCMGTPDLIWLMLVLKVGFSWDIGSGPSDDLKGDEVKGYQLMVDGQPVGSILPKTAKSAAVDKLQPGQAMEVALAMLGSDGQPITTTNAVKVCLHMTQH